MALIKCPECGSSISDKAEKCPHCGLPASYFPNSKVSLPEEPTEGIDYKNLGNLLLSFDRDYTTLFMADHYVSHRDEEMLRNTYEHYYRELKNKLIFQYVCNNASVFRMDIDSLKHFLRKMHTLSDDITTHNTNYIEQTLANEKEYFDDILKDIDPNIKLDDEQRRAVVTDDDYCLLVAGAGAGKTTTMAAKVKYLVEKKRVILFLDKIV